MLNKKAFLASALTMGIAAMGVSSPAQASSNPFIGEIMPTGIYNFCPRGWAATDGQLLPIASNQALFSLLGTTYGGDGRTTFALPDLRGRVPMHTGTGPGLTPRREGQKFGSETNTLNVTQMPSHTHQAGIRTANADADSDDPQSDAFARTPGVNNYSNTPVNGGFMANGTVQMQPSGNNQPVNNLQPTSVIRYCIALQGVYPSRN